MSDMNPMQLEVEALCGELVEEVIDEQKFRRLEKLIQENDEAAWTYIEYMYLHAALGHRGTEEFSSDIKLSNITKNKTALPLSEPEEGLLPLSWPRLDAFYVPMVSILIAFGLLGTWFLGGWKFFNKRETPQVAKVQVPSMPSPIVPCKEKQKSEYIAELTWLGEINGNGDDINTPMGSLLTKGETLHIQRGDVRIRFNCGVEVTLHGPALFHVESSMLGKLEYGTLEARVPPEAIGFLIETPASRVKDLGTEFGLSVKPNGDTNIKVLNGEVEAEPKHPWLTGGELCRKLFEGDSLRISPPVTESFCIDFDTPDALEVFDIVRHDPTTCLLDSEAGLLTLKTQRGSIFKDQNNNSNIFVVPIPDCDFETILTVNRFKPNMKCNHVSLAAFNDQNNIYRISYWFASDNKLLKPNSGRSFIYTKEENACHGFVADANGEFNHPFDMKDHPFRLRVVRQGNTISTYWSKESGPWFCSGETSCQCELRFVGFFVAEGGDKERPTTEFTDCVIDSFELKLPASESQNK